MKGCPLALAESIAEAAMEVPVIKLFATAALLGTALAGMPVQAASVTIGTARTGSAFPFGANAYLGGYYSQQIFRASSFAAPIGIDNVTFFQTLYPGSANTGTYRVFLSTTKFNDIANFDINTTIPYADPSYTKVFDGVLPTVASGKLSLTLTTAFDYQPSLGNLLLTVFNPTLASNGTGYFDADNRTTATNFRFSAYPYNLNQGLVTQFSGTAIAAVPEAATWGLLIVGFGLVGATARRRRSAGMPVA